MPQIKLLQNVKKDLKQISPFAHAHVTLAILSLRQKKTEGIALCGIYHGFYALTAANYMIIYRPYGKGDTRYIVRIT
ncbi:hypothetical protein KKG22_03805 [Patescibacteria group bacterium]|nr:hypothetical protein [Patescibacteria group bacterium]MBU1721272.1 hypothetical protein [Patescibacteria group bacterium]MBU1901020.1 hypothetical protein [Patescibacteria group bacterium]